VNSYYDLLAVAPGASPDEIRRAFRRAIATCHPDKVQHLGSELQELAAVRAAELTRAYRTLSDTASRADYDSRLSPVTSPLDDGGFPQDRATADALVRRAVLVRFRDALREEFGSCDEASAWSFDVVCSPPRKGLLAGRLPPCVLGRLVPEVDAAVLRESWAMALRLKQDEPRDLCVFLMGPVVAPAAALGRAIEDQRRRQRLAAGQVTVVPVNTRTWSAHVPTDAPPVVRPILKRLQSR